MCSNKTQSFYFNVLVFKIEIKTSEHYLIAWQRRELMFQGAGQSVMTGKKQWLFFPTIDDFLWQYLNAHQTTLTLNKHRPKTLVLCSIAIATAHVCLAYTAKCKNGYACLSSRDINIILPTQKKQQC